MMTRPVICRYVSVAFKQLSVVNCRHGLPGSLEKVVYHSFDLSSKLHVSVLFVKVVVECVTFVVSYGGESIVNVAKPKRYRLSASRKGVFLDVAWFSKSIKYSVGRGSVDCKIAVSVNCSAS